VTLSDDTLFERLAGDQACIIDTPVELLTVTVPGCPEWSARQLINHVGRVHKWATALLVADPPEDFGPSGLALVGKGPEILDEFATVAGAAIDELRRRPLDGTVYAWGNERERRFWLRRLANETSVHRADLDATAGRPMAIAPDLAADGIDELFAEFLPLVGTNPLGLAEGDDARSVHVHCTDVDGEWVLRFGPDGWTVDRAHEKSDVAARGPASDLVLALWGRHRPQDVGIEVLGDADLFDSLLSAINIF
jgi:uncharacterized protein (TIGR03083 family)